MSNRPDYDGTAWDRVATETDHLEREASSHLFAALTRLRRIQHLHDSVDEWVPEHLRLALEEAEAAYGWLHDEWGAERSARLAREDAALDAREVAA